MSNHRKQIIINEIVFWKKNKMLPEHYCDFLMSLYTEGDQTVEIQPKLSKAVKAKEQRKFKMMNLLLPIVAIGVVILLFTVNLIVPLLILTVALGVSSIVFAFYMMHKNHLLVPSFHVAGAILLLAATVQFCSVYATQSNLALYIGLALNCLMWLVTGLKLKLLYFTVAGVLGCIAIISYYLASM